MSSSFGTLSFFFCSLLLSVVKPTIYIFLSSDRLLNIVGNLFFSNGGTPATARGRQANLSERMTHYLLTEEENEAHTYLSIR
jgi:hypothetical protein